MRGKSTGKEIQALDAGLTVGAREDYIPPEVEKDLGPMSAKELVTLGRLGDRLKDATRIRNGWVWMMLRRKVGHGHFKKTIEEERLRYNEIWQDMCYARAVQRFPGFAGRITGNAIRKVLTLPAERLYQIEESITGIPASEAKKLTRSWIEKEYRKIQLEKQRPPRKKPPAEIPEVTELDGLVANALSALGKIAELKLAPPEYARAERYRGQIEAYWNRASYNLRDPEHKNPPPWELHPMYDDVSEEAPL